MGTPGRTRSTLPCRPPLTTTRPALWRRRCRPRRRSSPDPRGWSGKRVDLTAWRWCETSRGAHAPGSPCSRPQPLDRTAPGDQLERPLQAVVQLQVVGDAEAAVDRGDDVRGRDRIAAWVSAGGVAGPVHETALDAAARQSEGVAEVPVVAAGP